MARVDRPATKDPNWDAFAHAASQLGSCTCTVYAVHMQPWSSAHAVHMQPGSSAHAMHMQPGSSHMQCTCSLGAVHMQCTCSLGAVTCSAHVVHSPHGS